MKSMLNFVRGILPRNIGALIAVMAIIGALAYSVTQDPPVGRLTGKVLLMENGASVANAEIRVSASDSEDDDLPTVRVRANSKGEFTLNRLPAGDYTLSANSDSHTKEGLELSVLEGKTTNQNIIVAPSKPLFALKQHQRVFTPDESASVSVSGYVDFTKPQGKDAARLRLYRTRLSRLLSDPKANEKIESVGNRYDDSEDGEKLPQEVLRLQSGPNPAPLDERDVAITDADREGFYYQKVAFGKLPVGMYLLDLSHDKKAVWTWILVTNTALVTKGDNDSTLAFAANLQTGAVLPGAEIDAYRNGKIVTSGKTDGRGLLRIANPAPPRKSRPSNSDATTSADNEGDENPEDAARNSRLTFVARLGEDEAVVNSHSYRNESDGEYRVHAYTDRPLYRPGQRLYFKGIVKQINPASAPAPYPEHPDIYPMARIELRDPDGEKVLKTQTQINRYGSFFGQADLPADAPTGVYNLIMNIGGEEHTHDITVASYKKPEFVVKVTPGKKRYVRGDTVEMTVSATYYFGAPVAGAKLEYYVYAAPDWSAELPDNYESDPEEVDKAPAYYLHGESYYGATETGGKATLDADGKAVIRFPAKNPEEADGPQEQIYTVSATVTEPGTTREVLEDGIANVAAGDFRLTVSPEGYVAMPNHPTNITVTAKDGDGKPAGSQALELEIGQMHWTRDSHNRRGGELTKYYYKQISLQKITTGANGRIVVPVTPGQTGNLLIKVRGRDSKNRKILARADLWCVDDSGGDLGTQYADLSVLTDKRSYRPGDTARVLLNTARVGQTVLLTIEGDTLHNAQIVPITKHSTVIMIPVRAEYGPNVTLAACYVQDKRFARSDAPLRVKVPQRELNVTVTAGKPNGANAALPRYQPGDSVTYTVQATDADGKPAPCEFSLGVVDESIYALQEDNPTALKNAFYPRRQNRVETAYSFAVEYLGDADKAEPKITARKKFPDTAYWNPAVETDSQGKAEVTFALPDNLTTWRTTVTAQTLDAHFGRAVCKIIETKYFFVRMEMPRFLTQGDRSQVMAVLHNETDIPQTALVRLAATGLRVEGENTFHYTLAPGQAQTAVWTVAADASGTANLRLTAWTVGGAKQYTDGVEMPLTVRPHGRETITVFAGELTAKNPESETVRLDPQAIPAASRLTVRVTPSVGSAMTGALDYLIGYPYGCTEQTTSRFLADLQAERALKSRGLRDIPHAKSLPKMVRYGLNRLYALQHRNTGGWGWWEHDADESWLTAYALTGLAEAKAAGYPVRESVLESGRKAALKMLAASFPAKGTESKSLKKRDAAAQANAWEQAQLLYTLTLAGSGAEAYPYRGKIALDKMNAEGLAYLVLADKRMNLPPGEAFARLTAKAQSQDGGLHWQIGEDFEYGSRAVTAVALRALIAVNPNEARIRLTLRWLMQHRTGEYWADTRDTAAVLAALSDFVLTQPEQSPDGSVQIRLNGRIVQTFALTAATNNAQELVLKIPASELRPDKNDITLERIGGGSLVFYTVQMRQTAALDPIPALASKSVSVQREYLRVVSKQNAKALWNLQSEPTNNQLVVGDRIKVRLTIDAPRDLSYVLIEDAFPSGLEATERGDSDDVVDWGYWWSSVDLRDDRIAFFARTLSKGHHVIEYNLRAQTPGMCRALPTLVQAMYSPNITAETAEDRLEIK